MMNKFSIVTPVYNSEAYISETIESILFQKGDFEIEYIVVDGCSTDNSLNLIKSYQELLKKNPWLVKCNGVSIKIISEEDDGMYDAINKGFDICTGNICAYLNADDIYLPGALNVVSKTFSNFSEIQWLKGITSYIDKDSMLYKKGECYLYNNEWIQKGIYGTQGYFIQQDSVFWRASLWNKVEKIDKSLRLAGDFYLWVNFSKWTNLYSLNIPLSCFRTLENQLSSDMEKYNLEVSSIEVNSCSLFEKIKIKIFFIFTRVFKCRVWDLSFFIIYFFLHKETI